MEVIYRIDKIKQYCTDKKVLHLGFLQHRNWESRISNKMWVHKIVEEVSKECHGVDYLEEEVYKYNKIYNKNNYFGDVTKLNELNLKSHYDIILCGELIEHLANPGLMLDGISSIMNNNTKLIITTPNAWRSTWVKMGHRGLEGSSFLNKEHVSWYTFHTLKQLLERYNFIEDKYDYYYSNSYSKSPYRPIYQFFKSFICRILPNKYDNPAFPKEKQAGLFFVSKYNH